MSQEKQTETETKSRPVSVTRSNAIKASWAKRRLEGKKRIAAPELEVEPIVAKSATVRSLAFVVDGQTVRITGTDFKVELN